MVVILVWVDDMIVAASDMVLMSKAKQMLQERFRMKDLGRLSYFLGIADVRSHLSGSSAIQPLAAREEIGTNYLSIYLSIYLSQ